MLRLISPALIRYSYCSVPHKTDTASATFLSSRPSSRDEVPVKSKPQVKVFKFDIFRDARADIAPESIPPDK